MPTLNAPLKEGLASFAGPHPIVVARSVVAAHGTEARLLGHLEDPDGGGLRAPQDVRLVTGAALVVSGRLLLTDRLAGPATGTRLLDLLVNS